MRFRRHLPPLHEWKLPLPAWKLPGFDAPGARRWGLAFVGALLAGYLTAYLILFPAPLLHGHGVVPRVLGLSLSEASTALKNAGLQVQDGGSQSHLTAPQGTIVWQDPPPGVSAPAGLRVTLVASEGPPKIPVPDVTGLEGSLAQRLITAAGRAVAPVAVVVSRGAPTIPVPGLLGLSQADARTRLELDGLALGLVTRRRASDATPGTVVAQKPAPGTLAAPGTVVDIVVARSP